MKSIKHIEDTAIKLLSEDEFGGAADFIINAAEELAASEDEITLEISDKLAFFALGIMRRTDTKKEHVDARNMLERIQNRLVSIASDLQSTVDKVLDHLQEFEDLVYVGRLVRNRGFRRGMEGDQSISINAASRKLTNGEGLSAEEWADLSEKLSAQLDYFERWLPAPRSGIMSKLASRGYIREGAYYHYVYLILERSHIDQCISKIRRLASEGFELLDESDKLESTLFQSSSEAERLIEEFKYAMRQTEGEA